HAGRLIEVKIPAPSLKGNLLGDPTEQSIAVYLPASYESAPAKRYPTLYLLHGYTGTNKTWTSPEAMNIRAMMDEMIKSGRVQEMIVVAPNGWNAYKGAFYTNSAVTGNWEDYIYRDLVQYVDANYRTITRAESRGIAGHSMGGYGALTLAMNHADVFSAVYALSPCCLGMEGDFTAENSAWLKTLRLKSKEQISARPRSLEEFYQNAFVALSAAFSPNLTRAPFFVDFPYQERDGVVEKNEPAFAKWRSKMPLYMIGEKKADILKLRGIAIDVGEKEEFSHIRITTGQFSKALSEQNIPHMFEIYQGGTHNNKVRQRLETRLLQFFSEKLDFTNPNAAALEHHHHHH
uniref:Esterase n=1 Tax=soil metagenome TaxID=410658 RepID=UPI003908BC50